MINFKKISAIAGSGLMLGMTMGIAAAANYPAPFVAGGAADVAIVYGTGSGVSILDAVEAGSIQANLQSFMTGKTTTTGSVSGEAVALFTGGTKLYINDSLNSIKNTVTDSDMPIALADQTFSGDVDAKITQSVQIGANPRVTFERQPASSDDPTIVLRTSTTDTSPMFNLSATFNKAINPDHTDSHGESFNLFGMDLTVSSSSDSDSIVLLKSAEKVDLSSDAPSASVVVAGATYTVELVSASDTAATVKVTDSSGASESKEIDEAASKKINGITVAVTTADETNLKLSATVVAGSDKLTLEDGQAVLLGENNDVVDGTLVDFDSGNATALTKLIISFDAPDSDSDAIKAGGSYLDPVFGTIKLDFAGVNIPEDSTARELIEVYNSGDDAMNVKFTEWRGKEFITVWAVNSTTSRVPILAYDADDVFNISVMEREVLHKEDYTIVGNEDDGYLLRLDSVTNSSGTIKVTFTDVFGLESKTAEWSTGSGTSGTLSVGGFDYTVSVSPFISSTTAEFINVSVNSPDSSTGGLVLYPTIETDKGAKVSFYEPLVINLTNPYSGTENSSAYGNDVGIASFNVTALLFPDGDGYETVTVSVDAQNATWNFTADGTVSKIDTWSTAHTNGTLINIGKLVYSINNTGVNNSVKIALQQPGTGHLDVPALVTWEEEDKNNVFQALVTTLELGGSSDDGLGVGDVLDTWTNDSTNWEATLKSDNDISKQIDYWGSIVSIDSSETDQSTAKISYPDEQVYAEIYIAASDAAITAGGVSGGATQLGDVLVKDSEVSSVSSKNLVVVGGSCINSVAANLVDAGCGSAWMDSTGVGSGQFLIQSFGDAYTTGKIALLVAGYDAADTVNAAKYLRTQTVDTTAGKKYKGTTSTSAELQTTETTA